MHEHRRLGVPVRLGADVDARDDDVDLTAVLGERDDRPQHPGDPVHVLGAGVHGDLGAGRDGVPLHGHAVLAGEVDRGEHAPALGLGDGARARASGRRAARTRVRPSGWRRVGVVTMPSTMLAVFAPYGRSTGTGRRVSGSRSYSVNVPGGAVGVGVARDQRDELVGVERAAPLGLDHLLGVGVELAHRVRRRLGHPQRQAGARRAGHPQHAVVRRRRGSSGAPSRDRNRTMTCSMPERVGARGERAHDAVELGERHLDDGPHVEQDAVPAQAGEVGVGGAGRAQAVERRVEHGLHLRQRPDAPVVVAQRREVADVAGDDEPPVLGHVAAPRVEQVDVGGRGQARERRSRAAATARAARRPWGAGRAGSGPRRARARCRRRRLGRVGPEREPAGPAVRPGRRCPRTPTVTRATDGRDRRDLVAGSGRRGRRDRRWPPARGGEAT